MVLSVKMSLTISYFKRMMARCERMSDAQCMCRFTRPAHMTACRSSGQCVCNSAETQLALHAIFRPSATCIIYCCVKHCLWAFGIYAHSREALVHCGVVLMTK
eukprot:scpid90702/ scgid18386/ 